MPSGRQVETNLRAANLRLLFVADGIPDELTRVVEFLNEQMPRIEVLAVEIKQFQAQPAVRWFPGSSGVLLKPLPDRADRWKCVALQTGNSFLN